MKSLAEEARIIRLEERRSLDRKKPDLDLYLSLRHHRRWDVRREQRSTLIAYAFLRGRQYAQVEKPDKSNPPDLARVKSLIDKFGSSPGSVGFKITPEQLKAWVGGVLPIAENPFVLKKVLSVA